jgi:hypothetical protein
VSWCPGCSSTLSRTSQSCKYSTITPTVLVPLISEIHLLAHSASWTVHLLIMFFGTAASNLGARSAILCPCNQRSCQKSVPDPSPISTCMATEKKDLALAGIWIDRAAQGWLGSIFCSHIHLIQRVHPSSCKLGIPRPPNSIGLQTLPMLLGNVLLLHRHCPSKRSCVRFCQLPSTPKLGYQLPCQGKLACL